MADDKDFRMPGKVAILERSNIFVNAVLDGMLGEVSVMSINDMRKKIMFLKYQSRSETLKAKAETYTINSAQALFHKKNAILFAEHHNNLILLYKKRIQEKDV